MKPNENASLDSFYIPPPEADEPLETSGISCDLVILGGGASGLAAAVSASDHGVRDILVYEKTGRFGGNAWMAVGMSCIGSKYMDRPTQKVTKESLYQETVRNVQGVLSPEFISDYLDQTGRTMDWLIDMGFKCYPVNDVMNFYTVTPDSSRMEGFTGKDPSHGPGFMGSAICTLLKEQCDKRGIPVILGSRGEKLLKDEDGHICGAVIRQKDRRLVVKAKAVIIASGGFAANMEMLKRLFPDYFIPETNMTRLAMPSSTGDGIVMVQEIGARPDQYFQVTIGGPCHHPWAFSLDKIAKMPHGLLVNRNGRRYGAEDMPPSAALNALNRQPGGIAYMLFDYTGLTETFEAAKKMTITPSEIPYVETLWKDIEKEKGSERMCVAQSIEELAGFIGADPAVLAAEIEAYNAACAAGNDARYGKKPEFLKPILKAPFYGILCVRFWEGTHGGIVVDEKIRVVDTENRAFPNLFAPGEISSGRIGLGGLKSNGLGWAFTTGRMAGAGAAEYIHSLP